MKKWNTLKMSNCDVICITMQLPQTKGRYTFAKYTRNDVVVWSYGTKTRHKYVWFLQRSHGILPIVSVYAGDMSQYTLMFQISKELIFSQ